VFEAEGGASQNLPDRLESYTAKTIVDRNALKDEMREISEAGYALEQEEFTSEVSSVAVPIRDYTRTLVGTLAVVGPSHRLTADAIRNDMAPMILKAGSELSKRLGYSA
jgi:DNA-binding IclR family transcriptional regulator